MILIIGCGIECYRDRGAGLSAAYRLAHRYRDYEGVRVIQARRYGGEIRCAMPLADRLILIDAANSETAVVPVLHHGSIAEALDRRDHGQVWGQLVENAKTDPVVEIPRRADIFLIKGENFAFGVALSQNVVASIEWVIGRVDGIVGYRGHGYQPIPSRVPHLTLVKDS